MIRRLLRSESGGALVLLAGTLLALLVANSPLRSPYDHVLHATVLGLSVQHWINDGLMALFFLLVGMEIKQELTSGALATWRNRALPGLAALGGMIVPALIFTLLNRGDATLLRGWAIPTATDIAFAIGALSFLGSRVPAGIRVILVGIAILDDLLAIAVIAIFYSEGIAFGWLVAAVTVTALLVSLNARHVYRLPPYLLLGAILWFCILRSGLHATLAGVILALVIPHESTEAQHRSPLKTTEHAIDRWVTFGILPLFAFANAGIAFEGTTRHDLVGTLPLGIALGLVVGKPVGVFGMTWLAVRLRLAPLPVGVTWSQVLSMALLCGIGFTMSLFIGGLAFEGDGHDHLMNAVRIGVIGGSVMAATLGIIAFRRTTSVVHAQAAELQPETG
ncbi:MAG: Na+/H+ antiporter NhaA [Thermomicrobiales bacterium]